MGIPLPDLLRKLREQEHRQKLDSTGWRIGLRIYSWLAAHPHWYHISMRLMTLTQRLLRDGSASRLRLPFPNGWTRRRDFPSATDATPFLQQWKKQQDRER